MAKAVRAIITDGDRVLVMHRNKQGNQYYTLVGGGVDDGEEELQTLVREVLEETGLQVTRARLVFIEEHPEPYRQQFIYLCEVTNPQLAAIRDDSEEAMLNRLGANLHALHWVDMKSFERLPFRTPQLQEALVRGFKKGFPAEPVVL